MGRRKGERERFPVSRRRVGAVHPGRPAMRPGVAGRLASGGRMSFQPVSIGFVVALVVGILTIILMLPMINMVPAPIGLLIIGLAIARLT